MFRTRLGVSLVMTLFALLVIAIISSFIFSDALGVLFCFLPAALLFIFPIVYFLISPSVYFDPLYDNKPPTQEELRVAENVQEWIDDDEELLAFTVGTLKSFPSIQILALTNKCLRIGADIGDRDIDISEITRVSWSSITSVLRIDLSIPQNKIEFEITGREWKRRAHEFSSAWDQIGEKATTNVDELIRLLRSRSFRSRIDALHKLGDTHDPRAVEALIEIVEDTGLGLRDRAAETLGKIKSPQAVDALIHAVQDQSDSRLQEYSAWALGEIGDPRAGDAILPLLQSGVGDVTDAARDALVKLGDKRIIPRLITDLSHPEEWVQYISASSLGEIGGESAIPHLEKLEATHRNVRHDIDIRRTAREAIKRILQRTSDPE
jgi:hypothetical protein